MAKKKSNITTNGKKRNGAKKKTGTPLLADPTKTGETSAGSHRSQPHNHMFPIVGVGASAGGLEAFKQLLAALPIDTGIAFVLVQHLTPRHESMLTELLSKTTKLPVREVTDGTVVRPNHIYVIPPNAEMSIEQGALRLHPLEEGRSRHMPIDSFSGSWA